MGIPGEFFASFGSRMGIPGRSFIPFGSWMRIPVGFFASFVSRMGISGRSFVSFGSWIRIPGRFLILRAHPKADLYKDGLIFYRDSAALYEFGHVVASRNGSSFLSLMKEKNQKKIKAMIAIYFCLVHVVNGRCFVRLGEESAIFAKFLLLRICSKSDLYKDGLIFYRDSVAFHEFGHVVASRNGSSFLSLMKEKKQKKIKAMIAISFYIVYVIHGRYFVRLGEGKAIFAGEMLLCTLYMRKKCLYFFRLCLVFVSKTCSNFGAMKRRESLPI
ncbi:hypothetical protein N425_03130 [Tannerella sp. oral taxon BU063 isolate Cell 2]|uniref:Uncharacterized protein n=1 Tax=Tannerella sp. oral taxon BU063 isolate Cell 2 TaxID=1411148 RepID=W2C885_9BACT|nr:hypothetical protein N425_03130 [Tannerella sp. oral taxon BU063 isolate Cell 2]